jgi:hypothetical protein
MVALPRGTSGPGAAGVGAVLVPVFLFMLADSLFQTVVPLGLAASGVGSGTLIGVLLAIPPVVGVIAALPTAAWGDTHGRPPVVRTAALVAAGALLLLAVVSYGRGFWWWLLPVVVFGLARLTVWVPLLAAVTGLPRPLRVQGVNSTVQRLAAALAAVVNAVLIGAQLWAPALVALAVTFVAIAALAARTRGAPELPAVPPRRSFAVGLSLLRRRSLQASSLVAIGCTSLVLLGNSFFPLALDAPPSQVAMAVLVLLLTRDLTSAALGPGYRRLVGRLGLKAALVAFAALGAAGLGLVVVAAGDLLVLGIGAALQGAAVTLAIGTANILATGEFDVVAGRGIRIATTNLPNGVVSIVLPVLFGVVFDLAGIGWVFGLGALVLLGSAGAAVLRMGGLSA